MAGSAITLPGLMSGFGGGLSPQQQALIDSVSRSADRIRTQPIDLEDPAALRQRAEEMQRRGDLNGAVQMINRARALEERARQQRDALTEVSPNVAIRKQAEMQARVEAQRKAGVQKAEVVQRLLAAGETATAQSVRDGVMTPEQGASVLTQVEGEDRRARAARTNAEKDVADARKEVQQSLLGGLSVAIRQGNPEARAMMERFGIDPKEPGVALTTMSDGELAALESIVTSQAFLNPDDEDAVVFQWERASEAQKDEVYGQIVDDLAKMVDDNKMEGYDEGGWWGIGAGGADDAQVSAYAELAASAVESLRKHYNIPEKQGAQQVLEAMQAVAVEGMTLAEMASALNKQLGATVAEDDLVNKYL